MNPRTYILISVIAFYALFSMHGCSYRIEESSMKIPVEIQWKSSEGIKDVTCRLFASEDDARKYVSGNKDYDNYGYEEYEIYAPGDTVGVTILKRGAGTTRSLYDVMVITAVVSSGMQCHNIVAIDEKLLNSPVVHFRVKN